MVDEGRRAAAEVQLLHRARTLEQFALARDLGGEALQIGCSALVPLGDNFIAAAIKTHGGTKRDMQVQRQRWPVCVARVRMPTVIGLAEIGVKLRCRGVRGIARAGHVITRDQFRVETRVIHAWQVTPRLLIRR